MLHRYPSARRCWHWLRRFRHRCGYGIHSPFAFQLVCNVVYERGHYYAYDALPQPSRGCAPLCKDLRLLFRLANQQQARRIALIGPTPTEVAHYLSSARPSAQLHCWDEHLPPSFEARAYDLIFCATPAALRSLLTQVANSQAAQAPTAHAVERPNAQDETQEQPAVAPLLKATSHLVGSPPTTQQPATQLHLTPLQAAPTALEAPPLLPTAPSQQLILVADIHRNAEARQTWQRLLSSPLCTVSFDLHRLGLCYLRPQLHRQHYLIAYL